MAVPNSKTGNDQPAHDVGISLPVLGDDPRDSTTIRRSKNAPRRAIVLAIVQLLIIAHIIQWLIMGTTTTPIEPSEAMEFAKEGVINFGLIFFALALLSTLILGRWFCGWGCHVVLLQDLCGWMMKKVGIRPKPFRSRLLMWVPLLLGLYMFVWPAFYRFVILPFRDVPDVTPWQLQLALTTSDFWATFPGLLVAVPFLLICGFATVYFLGAKGFCTYGCPYGGFFAAVDEYAPARIRVTDACEQCGHCTAVCTSNVRVHEEVREYGMVVDPGCMKCLDCVSVCPNDALYFGFGRTAANKGAARNAQPKRRYDFSIREEVAFAILFAVVFFAFRGDYISFPLLMAAGVAAVLTWVLWKAWRLTRDTNARLHRYQLKLRGKVRPAGWVLAGAATLIAIAVLHSGLVNVVNAYAGWHDGRVGVSPQQVFWSRDESAIDDTVRAHAQRGVAGYERAYALAGSSWTLSRQWRGGIHMRMAWLHAVSGDFAAAETTLRSVVDDVSGQQRRHLARSLGLVLMAQPDRVEDTLAWYRRVLTERPIASPPGVILDEFMAWASAHEKTADAHEILSGRLAVEPDDWHTMRWLALLSLDRGDLDGGVELLERAVELNADDQAAQELLRMARDAIQTN